MRMKPGHYMPQHDGVKRGAVDKHRQGSALAASPPPRSEYHTSRWHLRRETLWISSLLSS